MNNHSFNAVSLSDGSVMNVYAAFPDKGINQPVIIVLQEAFGVNNHIRNICERLCNEEYAVFAPDLFHRTGKMIEIPYSDFSLAIPHFNVLTTELLENDLTETYNWIVRQQNIIPGKIAAIGFCLGGRVSFLANAILPLSASVSYYGGGIEKLIAEGKEIQAPHLFFWGGKDSHISPDKIEQIITSLNAKNKEYTNVVISYADHGFNCDERPSYNPLAADQAWGHTLAFLENRLKD